ncbi:MAG: hypothetical protein KTR25_03880 [Myxococcales bacterium]|nr:hypothetical protein [Myxococcales bacterium]
MNPYTLLPLQRMVISSALMSLITISVPVSAAPDVSKTLPTRTSSTSRKHLKRVVASQPGTYDTNRFTAHGILQRGPDDSYILVRPISLKSRTQTALAQRVSLQRIPHIHARQVLRAPNGPKPEELEQLVSEHVSAILIRDRSGHYFLRSVTLFSLGK